MKMGRQPPMRVNLMNRAADAPPPGGRASSRAAKVFSKPTVYLRPLMQKALGFGNNGSRGRDPSQRWVRHLPDCYRNGPFPRCADQLRVRAWLEALLCQSYFAAAGFVVGVTACTAATALIRPNPSAWPYPSVGDPAWNGAETVTVFVPVSLAVYFAPKPRSSASEATPNWLWVRLPTGKFPASS